MAYSQNNLISVGKKSLSPTLARDKISTLEAFKKTFLFTQIK